MAGWQTALCCGLAGTTAWWVRRSHRVVAWQIPLHGGLVAHAHPVVACQIPLHGGLVAPTVLWPVDPTTWWAGSTYRVVACQIPLHGGLVAPTVLWPVRSHYMAVLLCCGLTDHTSWWPNRNYGLLTWQKSFFCELTAHDFSGLTVA
jgi:hypothetical protein